MHPTTACRDQKQTQRWLRDLRWQRSSSFSIELTGTNDDPIATFSDTQSAIEGSVSINGQLTSADVGTSDDPVYALVGAEIPGLTINADGSWLFDPTVSAYDSLQVDQVDHQCQLLSLTIRPTDRLFDRTNG